jgi:hypothetical protein
LDCDEEDNNNWFIEKRSTPADCDMPWISRSDEGTFYSLLSHIGANGGMGDLITAIAGVSPPHVKRLAVMISLIHSLIRASVEDLGCLITYF